MKRLARPLFPALLAFSLLIAAFTGLAAGKASHKGWPHIDGRLKMHSSDRSGRMGGTGRSDELLGGHGNDVILGRGAADVIWGDYKPCCQPTHQHDVLLGGRGRDHIYASHGFNRILAGAGRDLVHAHFGRGIIDCGGGRDKVYISHRSRPGYRIRHCEKLDYRPERMRR
jgi:RTX calcium-binding nonapeptide repeat (4 copies)